MPDEPDSLFVIARSAATKQSREGYEIAAHLSGARNDSGKQPDEIGATTKVWRRWKLVGEIFGVALVSVVVGVVPGDGDLVEGR